MQNQYFVVVLGCGDPCRVEVAQRVHEQVAVGLLELESAAVARQAAFMHLRHTPGTPGRIPYTRAVEDTPLTESATMLDPRTPWSNPVVWFLAALRIGGHYRLGYTGGDPQHGPDAVSLTTPDGSRAEITPRARRRRQARRAGDRAGAAVGTPRARPPAVGTGRPA